MRRRSRDPVEKQLKKDKEQKKYQGKYPLIQKKHHFFAREVQGEVQHVIRIAFRQGRHGVWRTYEIDFEKRGCVSRETFDKEAGARQWVYDAIPDPADWAIEESV
jgi:hypothetical protein